MTLTVLAARSATVNSVPATPVFTVTISGLDEATADRLIKEFPQAVKA